MVAMPKVKNIMVEMVVIHRAIRHSFIGMFVIIQEAHNIKLKLVIHLKLELVACLKLNSIK